MIAIYYVGSSASSNMFVMEVKDDCFQDFLDELDKQSYPYPESDVLFIENDRVVNTWKEKER